MEAWLSYVSVGISFAALSISLAGARIARGQLHGAELRRARDFSAEVVAELVGFHRADGIIVYTLRVTNAGPASATRVDVSVMAFTNDSELGRILCRTEVAPALVRGEHRVVELALPVKDARFDDRGVALELVTDYFDDTGVRGERLGLVLEREVIWLDPGRHAHARQPRRLSPASARRREGP